MKHTSRYLFLLAHIVAAGAALAFEYPYAPYNEGKMDPQLTGWPLNDAEKSYILKAEYERRPGSEANQHKPALWPAVPSAGNWGGTSWLDTHANLVKVAESSKGPIDVLLVGDSITMQWGAAWPKHFPGLKTVNIGIGGDKTQNVLWRLDHGGVDGLEPRLCVLLIGNNNMFFTPETGIGPAAQGIQVCVQNLREKFPKAPVVVVKIFPAHSPGNRFYEDIKKVNAALDALNLEADPKVRVLDIWGDMVNNDGTLKKELFTPDNIHLSQEGGYKLYAEKLKPLMEAFLAGKDVPKSTPRSYPTSAPANSLVPAGKPAAAVEQAPINAEPARTKQVIYDDNLATGWINNPVNAMVELSNTSPVRNGKNSMSIATQSGGTSMMQLNHPEGPISVVAYRSLEFWLHGGKNGGQSLRIVAQTGGGATEAQRVAITPAPEAGKWTKHSFLLSNLGIAGATDLVGLRIIEEPATETTFYLDDLMLTGVETSSAKSANSAKSAERASSGAPIVPVPAVPTPEMLKPTPKTADGKSLIYPYAPYNDGKMDPQLTGWPLTEAEQAWVARGEYTRKPGHEAQKHLPEMWFVVPTAGWITPTHTKLLEQVKAAGDYIDIALIGDSITQGWGGGWDGAPFNDAWKQHFGKYKTLNLGIGGDRMENVLWRLDHGALDGTSPKVIVLMIGVNNAPLVFANGVPVSAAAQGIKLCIENLRLRCPKSQIVLVKILPAFNPENEVGLQVVNINALLDKLNLDRDSQIHVLDFWKDFTNADGTLKIALYSDGHLHLGSAGYEVFAGKLQTVIEKLLVKP